MMRFKEYYAMKKKEEEQEAAQAAEQADATKLKEDKQGTVRMPR